MKNKYLLKWAQEINYAKLMVENKLWDHAYALNHLYRYANKKDEEIRKRWEEMNEEEGRKWRKEMKQSELLNLTTSQEEVSTSILEEAERAITTR